MELALLLWPALGFLLYGALYAGKAAGLLDDAAWRERPLRSSATTLIGLPFVACCWLLLLGRRAVLREPPFDEIAPGIQLGGLPMRWHRERYRAAGITAAVNLCFEYPRPCGYPDGIELHYLPALDSTAPEATRFAAAVEWAAAQVGAGRTLLVHCAAGHGRSATLATALLVRLGRAASIEESEAHLRRCRGRIHLTRAQRRLLATWQTGVAP